MSKRWLWLPPILGLLVLAAMFWRIQSLSSEVDRLARLSDATPPPPLAGGAAPIMDAPAALPEPPRLAAGAPAEPATPSDLARLRARVESLEKDLKALQDTTSAAVSAFEEITEERRLANQGAAHSASRNVISALAQFQQSAKADEDSDGTGEYGGFLEMAGAIEGRMASRLAPPVLSGAFRTLTPAGEATRSGYLFRIYLPDARGRGVGEPATGFAPRSVDANLAEFTWCMYAWPVEHGRTGTLTYFTNQGGDVLVTDAPRYSGSGAGPAPDAAFVERGPITGAVAIDGRGSDGNEWKQAH